MAKVSNEETKSYEQVGKVAEEVFAAFRTVLAFNAQTSEQARYASKLQGTSKYAVLKGLIYGFYIGLLSTIVYWTTALGLLSGAWLMNTGKNQTLDIGKIAVIVTAITEGIQFLGDVAPCLKDFADACILVLPIAQHIDEAEGRVKTLTKQFKLSKELAVSEGVTKLTSGNPMKVTFDNVSFSYPSRKERLVLNKASFTINAGQTVALIGGSGSGKSTCIQLLLRFYELTDGHIKINDRNIVEFDLYDYHEAIAVVNQEPVLFATSIQDNIRFGKINSTQDDVIEAAKQAHAHDFIMKLPQGYDTMVGERGAQLSGGQRQRIVLARALIRKPNLLILDEATSALDPSSEKIIQQALERSCKGRRTTLVIAHRLSTIRNADWIIVLEDGAVVEQGSHDDLIAANYIYANLFKNYPAETINVQSSEIANVHESEDFSTEIILSQEINNIQTNESEVNRTSFEETDAELLIDESPYGSLRSLVNLLKLNSPEWPYLLTASLFTIAFCAVSPAFSISMVQSIDAFSECSFSARMTKLYIFTAIIITLGIVVVIFSVIAQGSLAVAGARLTNRLRIKTFGCILRQEVGWFDEAENSVGSLCSCLATDTLEIQKLTGVRFGLVIHSVSILLIALVLGMIFSWALTLVAYALLAVVFINAILNVRRNTRLATLFQKLVLEYSDLVTQSVRNIRTVYQLNRQYEILKSFANIMERRLAIPSILKSGLSFALSYPVITFMLPALCSLTLVLLDHNLIDSQRTIFSTELARSSASAKRLCRIFKRKPMIDNWSTEGHIIENFSGSIEFENVTFAYPTRKSLPVLNKFHLAIKPGQSVALVGSSGCGKSTVIQLLERFYDCNEGRV
ncbi:unnamed protein product, partial [Rotaria socialis]